MKKIYLIAFCILLSVFLKSQTVTSISMISPFNANYGNEFCMQDNISLWAILSPVNPANKWIKFSVDSGSAAIIKDSMAMDSVYNTNKHWYDYAHLDAVSEGTVVVKARAMDGSGVEVKRRFTIKNCQKSEGFRISFNDANLNTLFDEHQKDTLQTYTESIEDGCLKLVVNKMGPCTSLGIPSLTWKTSNYGFSPLVLSIGPGNARKVNMSANKNVRIKMKIKTESDKMIDGAKSGCRFSIGLRSTFDLSGLPMSGSNIIDGLTETNVQEGGDFKSYVINYTNNSWNGSVFKCDSSNVAFCYMAVNHGRAYDLVTTMYQKLENKQKDYKGTIWIKYIAFGSSADSVPVEEIDISGDDSLMFVPGFKISFTASVLPDDATDKVYFWSTSDKNIATIDGSGKMTMKKPGTVKIIATSQDGSGTIGEKSVKLYCNGECPLSITGNSTDYAVYPNPAHDILYISGTSDLRKYDILNASGQVVIAGEHSSNNHLDISIQSLPLGIYFLRCYASSGELIIKKIIKE